MIYLDPQDPQAIAEALTSGLVVALPTETVFGLAVSLDSASGLQNLIALKNRPLGSGTFFTLVPESRAALSRYVLLDPAEKPTVPQSANAVTPTALTNRPSATSQLVDLLSAHFPGPLTLILPKNPAFRHPYFDHLTKIGVRTPDTSLFSRLLPLSGPLLLTSANPRGLPAATTPAQVAHYFQPPASEQHPSSTKTSALKPRPLNSEPPSLALVSAPAGLQPPSTVVDFTTSPPKILREGSLSLKF